MTDHAKLSASGSYKWLNCPGSVKLEEGFPDVTSPFAAEGTAAHEVAQQCLDDDCKASEFLGATFNIQGITITVDEDMVASVQDYIDFCHNIKGEVEMVEQRVDYSKWVHEGFGTADFIKVHNNNGENVINCVDLKYGKGVRVDADWNTQAMLYGLGVYNQYNVAYDFNETDFFNLIIMQPRLDHVSEFQISLRKLLHWAETEAKVKAELALSENAYLEPGEWCRWCKAKAGCPALAEQSLTAALSEFTSIEEEEFKKPKLLSNAEIGKLLQHIPAIQIWCKSLEAYAFEELNSGKHIPGYKLVQGRAGNRAWIDEEGIPTELSAIGLKAKDYYKPQTLKTPAQIDKVLKAHGYSKDEIFPLCNSPEGKPTLAKESDKRQAIQPTLETDFGVILTEK